MPARLTGGPIDGTGPIKLWIWPRGLAASLPLFAPLAAA